MSAIVSSLTCLSAYSGQWMGGNRTHQRYQTKSAHLAPPSPQPFPSHPNEHSPMSNPESGKTNFEKNPSLMKTLAPPENGNALNPTGQSSWRILFRSSRAAWSPSPRGTYPTALAVVMSLMNGFWYCYHLPLYNIILLFWFHMEPLIPLPLIMAVVQNYR